MGDERGAKGVGGGKVDVESVRQLLALMNEHGLVELEIEQEDLVVRLRKAGAVTPTVAVAPVPPAASPVLAGAPATPAPAAPVLEEKLPTINSPMVGTFYPAPSPDAEPYVKVGDTVTEETVVCMIEAMKVFNEIRAEMSGTIEKVLAKNAQVVEFGLPMFVVRPD